MNELVDQVLGERLMAHCAGFARYEKLSGSAPEMTSLREAEVALATAGFRTAMLMHEACISLSGEAAVMVAGSPFGAITHSFSQPSPAEGPSARLVDVGAGTDADFARCASAGSGLGGAIILVNGIASPAVAARCPRRRRRPASRQPARASV